MVAEAKQHIRNCTAVGKEKVQTKACRSQLKVQTCSMLWYGANTNSIAQGTLGMRRFSADFSLCSVATPSFCRAGIVFEPVFLHAKLMLFIQGRDGRRCSSAVFRHLAMSLVQLEHGRLTQLQWTSHYAIHHQS